ncbi:TVP38/TMEM64 family protein [Clostridium sp. OS1-26]|uniref:TVP38/TMEM64 family protein n=1 Tax=Clostridium sp. OS1-26 TaxID=3070681 RepID=UPI0027E0C8C0|nr:TVP38/TMEM64 family protein [Clostridium sp. OS1-26]WML32725.1 TVP38/TMEM64 family protein [Clostridium sp. OS1-26]
MTKSRKFLICKILLIIVGVFTVLLALKYLPYILELTMSLDKFRSYIVSLGSLGSIVFIFFQILQTVIAPIPGEVIQVAGGYIYGVTLGLIYTTLGMLLGAIIAFYFTRLIGGSFIEKLLKRKNSKWMMDIMDSKKFSIILFIIFLVPGLPKDFLIYVAGLTPIKPLRFFGILIISRFPWLLASVSIGSNLHYGNYASTIIISLIALISFILGMLYKDKLINKFSYDKNDQDSYKVN